MKVAIVGSGIAGLTSAYHLDKHHDVVVFEKNHYIGGHTDTHTLNLDGIIQRIDSGFIIFCPEFYPNFSSMLDDLGVPSKPTNMSFGAYNEASGLEYSASPSPKSLFCNPKNSFNIRFLRMIFDIGRFYQTATKVLNTDDETTSVRKYLTQKNYSQTFKEDHLFPMIGALWSIPPERVYEFPIRYLVEFMQAHGLMKIFNRPQWRVLKDGSNGYISALQNHLNNTEFRTNCGVDKLSREGDKVFIDSSKAKQEQFDAVIIATHADQAEKIISDPSNTETEILNSIPFQTNDVIVHTDESIMPPNRKAWSSWNVHIPPNDDSHYNTMYWMNSLQNLNLTTNVFVSLNEKRPINEDKILKRRTYQHPMYSAESVKARRRLDEINGVNRTFYAGAFWAWGFHEDGARTAVEAVKLLKVSLGDV